MLRPNVARVKHELDDSDIRFIDVFGKVVAARASDRDVGRDVVAGLHELHITALFRNRLKPGMTFDRRMVRR